MIEFVARRMTRPMRSKQKGRIMTGPNMLGFGSAWSRDRWSRSYLVICAVAAIAPAVFLRMPGALGLLLCLPVPLVFMAGGFPFLIGVTNRRPKLALSAVLGMALIASDVVTLRPLTYAFDLAAFWFNKSTYDRLVEEGRAKDIQGKPLRLVVAYEDQSIFVTANAFKYVIYDETDAAADDPDSVTGYWPYPGTKTGFISMDGSGEASTAATRHLASHYYEFFVN